MPLNSSVDAITSSQSSSSRGTTRSSIPAARCSSTSVAEPLQLERLHRRARDPVAARRLVRLEARPRGAGTRRAGRPHPLVPRRLDGVHAREPVAEEAAPRRRRSCPARPRTSRAGNRAGTSRAAGGECRSPRRAPRPRPRSPRGAAGRRRCPASSLTCQSACGPSPRYGGAGSRIGESCARHSSGRDRSVSDTGNCPVRTCVAVCTAWLRRGTCLCRTIGVWHRGGRSGRTSVGGGRTLRRGLHAGRALLRDRPRPVVVGARPSRARADEARAPPASVPRQVHPAARRDAARAIRRARRARARPVRRFGDDARAGARVRLRRDGRRHRGVQLPAHARQDAALQPVRPRARAPRRRVATRRRGHTGEAVPATCANGSRRRRRASCWRSASSPRSTSIATCCASSSRAPRDRRG